MTAGTNDPQSAASPASLGKAVARYPACTVTELLAASVDAHVKRTAIVSPGRDPLTYAALGRAIDRAKRALAAAGFGRGSRIAVVVPQGPECAVAVLAVLACATCAPLNPELGEDNLRELMAAMRIDAVIVGAPPSVDSPVSRAARAAGIAIVELRPRPDGPCGTFDLVAPPGIERSGLQATEPDDIALLAHTSGTTARPKIVPRTHRSIAEAARARVELGRVSPEDRSLLLLPMHNLASIRRVLLPPLVVGGSVLCVTRFEPGEFVGWLEQFAPTYYMASVAMQTAILESLERRGRPVAHSLRFAMSGGAPLPSSLQARLERALGVAVIQGYGITETGSIAQVPLPPERAPPGSVGRPSNVDIAIADESGARLGVDEIGEILVRGPEIFAGYENDPAANAAAFRDGWFRTGDVGRIDRDGYLFIAGRLKDIINRGGNKVAPSEVEEVLAQHPQVAQAAAFALSHPTLGEDVAAAVVLRDGSAASEDELREFARSRLPAFKVPTRVLVVPELPRGAFDKVKRDALAAVAARRLQAEFVPVREDDEAIVAGIFADVLALDRVGAFDNFFQLGGDSLRGMRAMTRIEAHFAVTMGVEALFRRPTVSALIAEIREAKRSARQ